jgi:hypothetical protein
MPERIKPVRSPGVPAEDDCEQDDLLDVSVVGISGRYIELAEQGKLDELVGLQEKRRHLLDSLTIIESELSQFGNPVWLLNFFVKAQNRAKKFGTELPRRARQLERQRTKLRAEIEEIEKQIARIEPLILKAPLHQIPVAERLPAIKSGENPFVLVRDYEIKLAASEGLSDLDICKRLDLTLTVQGAEAPVGMPEQWAEEFGETWKKRYGGVSYVAAYRYPQTKNRLQKMISTAKTRLRLDGLTSPTT